MAYLQTNNRLHQLFHEHQQNEFAVVIFRWSKIEYDRIIQFLFYVAVLVWLAVHILDDPNFQDCNDALIVHLNILILNYLYILQTVQMVHIVMCFWFLLFGMLTRFLFFFFVFGFQFYVFMMKKEITIQIGHRWSGDRI